MPQGELSGVRWTGAPWADILEAPLGLLMAEAGVDANGSARYRE